MTDQLAQVGDILVVNTGDSFVTRAIRRLTRSDWDHAATVTAMNDDGTIARIGEAEPGGYRVVGMHYPMTDVLVVPLPLTVAERGRVADEAQQLVGTPYNFLDIAALGIALSTHLPTPRWVARRLSRPDRLICSQACDLIAHRLGLDLFHGRLDGEVTPQDLATWRPGR